MIDPAHLEQVQRLVHVIGRPLLSRVCHAGQARLARVPEHLDELPRRVAAFRGVEPDPGERRVPRACGFEGLDRVNLGKVAQETQDQPRRDPERRFGLRERGLDPPDHGLERHPAFGMQLRIEEDLDVPHRLARHLRQVRPGEVEKVPLPDQNSGALVVEVQERLQVPELVRGRGLLDAPVRHAHPVALGQLEQHRGLERTLQVQVQLHLGQRHDQPIDVVRLIHASAALTPPARG